MIGASHTGASHTGAGHSGETSGHATAESIS